MAAVAGPGADREAESFVAPRFGVLGSIRYSGMSVFCWQTVAQGWRSLASR